MSGTKIADGADGADGDSSDVPCVDCMYDYQQRADRFRKLIDECVSDDDIRAILAQLVGNAKSGEVDAAELILHYSAGRNMC